jgi:hypothetical protein
MSTQSLDPRLLEDLKGIIDRGQAAGEIIAPQQQDQYTPQKSRQAVVPEPRVQCLFD